jgi:hypothetical protein
MLSCLEWDDDYLSDIANGSSPVCLPDVVISKPDNTARNGSGFPASMACPMQRERALDIVEYISRHFYVVLY